MNFRERIFGLNRLFLLVNQGKSPFFVLFFVINHYMQSSCLRSSTDSVLDLRDAIVWSEPDSVGLVRWEQESVRYSHTCIGYVQVVVQPFVYANQ